jgi:hypothetical protein
MMTTPGLQPADVLDNPYDDIDESSFSFVTDPAIKRLMAIVLGVVFIESAACKGHSSIDSLSCSVSRPRRCHAVVDVSCPFRRVTGPDKADSNTD